MNKSDEDKISSITCVKLFPEFNEIKVYYLDDHEFFSFDSSEEYEKFLINLKDKLAFLSSNPT